MNHPAAQAGYEDARRSYELGRRLGGEHLALHGHVRRVGATGEGFVEDAAVLALGVREAEQVEEGGGDVDVAGGDLAYQAALEAGAGRHQRVAHVPGGDTAVGG